MLIIFFRAVVVFFALLVVIRLMGKRQIGEMQPFEFVVTMLIAELVCIPMTDVSIPLSYGLVSVLAIFILHQVISLCERLGSGVKFLISGKPSLVITPEGVNVKELRRNAMDLADLAEAMRSQGYFNLDDLSYAIFESNGMLSALENPNRNDKLSALPLIIVSDGKINKDNLKRLDLDEKKLISLLDGRLTSLRQAEVLTMDKTGRVYLQKRGRPYTVFNLKKGG